MPNQTPSLTELPTIVGSTVVNASSVLIWISNTDKECIFFNQSWLNFTGRTLAQEYGFGWSEGVHPDDYETCLKIYNEAFDSREKFSMDYRIKKANSLYGWIRDEGPLFLMMKASSKVILDLVSILLPLKSLRPA